MTSRPAPAVPRTLRNGLQADFNAFMRPWTDWAMFGPEEIGQARQAVARAELSGRPASFPLTSRCSVTIRFTWADGYSAEVTEGD